MPLAGVSGSRFPSVAPWHCWLGYRMSVQPIKNLC